MKNAIEIDREEYGRLITAAVFRDFHVRRSVLPNLKQILTALEENTAALLSEENTDGARRAVENARFAIRLVVKDLDDCLKERYFHE